MDEKKKQGTLNGDAKNENGGHKNDELKNLIAGYVADQNLPVNFARMVADADKDVMAENIERFKAEYMKAIESGLSERLKGVPPRISREKENLTDPFLSGL